MIRKWLCVLFLIAMIGCKPESPLSPVDNQQDSKQPHSHIDKEVFTLYVENTTDNDFTIYVRPFNEVIEDYCIDGGLNSVGVAYGGECTEMGVFEWDSLTYLTGIYGWEVKDSISVRAFTGIATEDTVNTLGMSEYAWVFDEQTRWYGFSIIFIFDTGIEE